MKERRRGAELEEAILDAAWLELVERGYVGLTMEAVAERSRTSRPVLARRWSGKAPLCVAAIRRQMTRYPMEIPDRGDLRTELLEYLTLASDRVAGIAVVFTFFSSEYFSENQTTPMDLRASLIQSGKKSLATIFDRAIERGEIDPKKLIPPIDTLLGDLFRGYTIMNFAAPPSTLQKQWIDTIFLPLVQMK